LAQGLPARPERSADRRRRCGGRRAPGAGALDIDAAAIDPAEGDLRIADRLRDHELDSALADEAHVARFGVHRLAGIDRLGALRVDQERLAVMGEPNLLAVAEGLDARVLALPFSAPGTEQE